MPSQAPRVVLKLSGEVLAGPGGIGLSPEVLDKVAKESEECHGTRIEYWDDIGDDHVFRCIDCGMYYPIPSKAEKILEYSQH